MLLAANKNFLSIVLACRKKIKPNVVERWSTNHVIEPFNLSITLNSEST